jgi:hypothetical protein
VNADDLRALAKAVEPLLGASGGLHSSRQLEAYNNLVSRFRARVTTALERLTRGQDVGPDLTDELRLLAKALPGVRSGAEAATQGASLDPVE